MEIVASTPCDGGPVVGQVVQIADGEEPFRVRGCPAQAWSVGMLLSPLAVDRSP